MVKEEYYKSMMQVPIELETHVAEPTAELIGGWLSNPWVILGLTIGAIIVTFLIVTFILKWFLTRGARVFHAFQKVVLLVTVPKEFSDEEQKKKDIKELLAPAEVLFENLGGLRAQRGVKAGLFGRSDHFSFEIVADREGVISFYVVVPRYLQQFVEQQIQAQYSAAHVEEVTDYNIFSPKGVTLAAYLKLRRSYIFPINTYFKQNVDFLNAITNSLSRITEEDGAAIQIVARSARAEWHQFPAKVAQEMQQGKKLKEALKSAGGQNIIIKIMSDVLGAFSPGKAKTEEAKPLESQKPYQLSPMEQEIVKGLEQKTSKAGLDVNIRIVVSAKDQITARRNLNNIVDSFSQYTQYEYGNGFKAVIPSRPTRIIRDFIYRFFDRSTSFVLNTEEMTSLFHFPLSTTETPNIRWLSSKRAPAPVEVPKEGLILGKNVFRGKETLIRIKPDDRRRHLYIVGETGVGKSWFMSSLAMQDILAGRGVCVLDPHGDLIEEYILPFIPKERAEDVIYFNPADMERPLGLNLLEYDPKYPEQKTFLINEMINIMDKLYDLRQTGGPMFEQYMRNAMLLIMEHPESGSTLMEISNIMADEEFRHFKIDHSKNQVVNDFWTKQAEKAGGEAALSNMTPYITSKLNQFVANDLMRPIIAQQKSAFNFRKIMDERKILLVNLSKGKIGELNAYLLGLVLVGRILVAALSRTDIPEDKRTDFYLYIDEFQSFITDSINTILAEARKYRLCLTMAHQYLGQLVKLNDTSTRDAIFGNVGTIMTFRIGVEDTEYLAKAYAPVFDQHDLINIEKYNAYIRLLVDNQKLRAFNVKSIPPDEMADLIKLPPKNLKLAAMIKELSRLKYGRQKEAIEAEIIERTRRFGEPDIGELTEERMS